MKKNELFTHLQDIEWENFEVKEAKTELPKSIWETVSAFANTAGGWIVLGVAQKKKGYEIKGVDHPEKIQSDFTTTLRGDKFNRILSPLCKKYKVEGKTLLAFYISQAKSAEKPIYFNTRKNTFIRTGSGDQHATDEEINSMYRESSFSRRDEELTSLTAKDLDATSVAGLRNYLSSSSPEHHYNKLNREDFLEKLHVLKKGKVTYGGLIVLGKESVLNKTFSDFRTEYLEIQGTSYADAPERYSYRLSSEQNIFQTFFLIAERVFKRIEIPFVMDGRGVRDDDQPHVQALREALVNLCMHTDYFSPAKPRIRLFDDRIEFFNPGGLPKKLEYIIKEDFSLPRNPVVARIFRMMKLAENVGSGFYKMMNGWHTHTGKKPEVEYAFDYYKIVFPLKTKKSKNMKQDNGKGLGVKLGARLGARLGANEKEILRLIAEDQFVTIVSLSQTIGISTTAVEKNLAKLKDKGLLKRVGADKTGHWEVVNHQ